MAWFLLVLAVATFFIGVGVYAQGDDLSAVFALCCSIGVGSVAYGLFKSAKNCRIELTNDRIRTWDWRGASQTVSNSELATREKGVQRFTYFVTTVDGRTVRIDQAFDNQNAINREIQQRVLDTGGF